MRDVGVVVILGAALFTTACGDPASSRPPVDGGADATDAGGGPVVAAPDLRFKWVGAGHDLRLTAYTFEGTALSGRSAGTGRLGVTPLTLSGEVTSFYGVFSAAVDLEPMLYTTVSGSLPSIDADLVGLVSARSLVVSLDTSHQEGSAGDPVTGIYNVLVSGSQGGASYEPMVRAMVTVADLPTWAATHAAAGHVATALGPKDGRLYVTAFGRTGDDTRYETEVVTATLDNLVSKLQSLAAAGYVITALGRDGSGVDGAGGFVAIGTRPAGQTAARTVKAVDQPCVVGAGSPTEPVQPLFDEGFAIVGMVFHGAACDGSPSWLFIGQR